MGDRALVVFHHEGEVSPVCYLHAHGSRTPEYLERLKQLMGERKEDVNYASARFIGIAHADNADSCLSLGMWNSDEDFFLEALEQLKSGDPVRRENAIKVLERKSHGDAGIVMVDCADFSWQAFGGYLRTHEESLKKQAA